MSGHPYYDKNHRLVGVEYSNGYVLAYEYDGNDNLEREAPASPLGTSHEGRRGRLCARDHCEFIKESPDHLPNKEKPP
jgi:YD repeat-containing protein